MFVKTPANDLGGLHQGGSNWQAGQPERQQRDTSVTQQQEADEVDYGEDGRHHLCRGTSSASMLKK